MQSQGLSNLRLVCITDSQEKIVFWGTLRKNRINIDKVLQKGIPCEVECEFTEPKEFFRNQFAHKYWVPEDCAGHDSLNTIQGDLAKQCVNHPFRLEPYLVQVPPTLTLTEFKSFFLNH